MSLLETIRTQLTATPTDAFAVSSPRRIRGIITAATANIDAVAALAPADTIVKGQGIYFEYLGGQISPGGAITINSIQFLLQGKGPGVQFSPLVFLATPVLTTFSPGAAMTLIFTPPPLFTQDDLEQWFREEQGAAPGANQPYILSLAVQLAAGVAGTAVELKARYRIVYGLQEG